MRNSVRLLAFLVLALVSCGTKETPVGNLDNVSIGEEEERPAFCIVHPSKISAELKTYVGTSPESLLGKPVTKDEMCIYWAVQYVGDSPYDNRWIRDEQYDVLRENCDKIESESPSYVFLSLSVYAGTKDIILTADKTLFGREAGANLSDKFKIIEFEESEVLLSYPDGEALKRYEDDKTMTISEWAGMGGMLYDFYVVFNELPSEVYEEVTFDITIETTESLTLTGSQTVVFKN